MLGDNGVASYMKPGSVFIDMSSINPVASKEIAAALAERGIEMLDAPVSGGEPKAIDGTLSFMVGCKQEIFDAYKPVLDCAHTVGAPVPMTAQVQEVLQWLHNHDGGQKDHSAIAQYYEYLTGIQIGR